jgi:hypothetical protein
MLVVPRFGPRPALARFALAAHAPRQAWRCARTFADRPDAPAFGSTKITRLPPLEVVEGWQSWLNAAVSKTVSGDYSSDEGSNPSPSVLSACSSLLQLVYE